MAVPSAGYYDESGNWIENNQSTMQNEWTQAYDDNSNVYWYNNFTGVSQYEDPGGGY